jgi:hypothetical protein
MSQTVFAGGKPVATRFPALEARKAVIDSRAPKGQNITPVTMFES